MNNEPICTSTSTCLFNIIFYVESLKAAEQQQTFVAQLKQHFPCRSIFLIEDQKLSATEPKLALNGQETDDLKPKSACDQITAHFNLKTRERIPFLILGNLVEDIPTYVVWMQDPNIKNPILFNLKEIATKMVFEPMTCLHLREFARQLLTQMEGRKCGITDFSWFSISGWRVLLAQIFNEKERVDQLFHARVIRIKYQPAMQQTKQRCEIPSIYLQSWLAARLNWKVHDVEPIEGNMRISYQRFIHDTVVLIVPEATAGLQTGEISSVEIESDGKYHFLLKRNGKEPLVKVWISTQEQCDIPFHHVLTEPSKEQLVTAELFWRGTSEAYEETLRQIYQINWND